MQKISFIYPSDLGGLKTDENGNYLVPEGFEIYKIPTAEEVRLQRIAELQAQIDQIQLMPEPSDQEYLEFGKMMHPYRTEKMRLEMLNQELNTL